MLTKTIASLMLLGILSPGANAETESFARCEFNKGSRFASDILGTLLIAHY